MASVALHRKSPPVENVPESLWDPPQQRPFRPDFPGLRMVFGKNLPYKGSFSRLARPRHRNGGK